jgi:tRNA dimethylallyltransferase
MDSSLILITGPTASGKTALSIKVAERFGTEILSADSRQLFREMSIGTAKPSPAELAQVRHHFINHVSIEEDYNAGRFEQEALVLLEKLFKEHKVVVLTGGTGLYINALLNGMDELPNADPALREELNQQLLDKGLAYIQQQVKEKDPDYYATADTNNPQRLLRALEVSISSGKPYSSYRTGTVKERPFKMIKIGLDPGREMLYNRINERVDQMMAAGLLEEVRALLSWREKNALQTVGYSEMFDHIDGLTTLEKAVELLKRNTRRYAKRQMTWFRRDAGIQWFDPAQEAEIFSFIDQKMAE